MTDLPTNPCVLTTAETVKAGVPPARRSVLVSGRWDGKCDLRSGDVRALTGLSRSQLYRDRGAGLLEAPARVAGIKQAVFPARAVRAYFRQKFPNLLPQSR